MSATLSWYEALATADEHESRQAISKCVHRDDRPDLSVGQLVDSLLRWSIDTTPVPMDLALSVLTAALDRPGIEFCDQLERQTISKLVDRVLGWSVSLPNGTSNDHRSDYRVLSRAVAAGIYSPVVKALSLTGAAHATCVALHSCLYVQAAQALSVLCGHIANTRHERTPRLLIRFVDQSYTHLTALAAGCAAGTGIHGLSDDVLHYLINLHATQVLSGERTTDESAADEADHDSIAVAGNDAAASTLTAVTWTTYTTGTGTGTGTGVATRSPFTAVPMKSVGDEVEFGPFIPLYAAVTLNALSVYSAQLQEHGAFPRR